MKLIPTSEIPNIAEAIKQAANKYGSTCIVTEMIQTARKSCDNLRAQVENVRYGKPGTILFEFQGRTYAAPEPSDVMPVGHGEGSKSWALKQVLDGTAKLV